MVYTHKYTIKWHDTAPDRRVRPTQILMYMQETANLHCIAGGESLDVMRDKRGLAFILSKLTLSFYKDLYAYDEIEVDTWVSEGHGLSFPRCFRIRRGDEIVAEGLSVWALYDMNTQKLVRSETFEYPFSYEPILELDLPRRIRFPADAPVKLVGERGIAYSDIDYNMHMNNTKYPDMICDFIPDIENKKILSMTLVYIREAKYKDNLKVYLAETASDGLTTYSVRTVNSSGETCLEAEVIVE